MNVSGRRDDQPSALIVGGSLAGLLAAHALARVGIASVLLERTGPAPRTGAALAVNESHLAEVIGHERAAAALGGDLEHANSLVPMTWSQIHRGLADRARRDPLITVRHRTSVNTVGQNGDHAWAALQDGTNLTAPALIGADGHRSVVRRYVAPDHPDASFAGYTLWLGTADEAALPSGTNWPRSLDIRSTGPHYLLGYPLRGEDGSNTPGSRRLGWAWYDSTRNDVLRRSGSIAEGVVHHSLRAADIPEAVYASLATDAKDSWPSPWRHAILDSIQRRDVMATPISEYVPKRLTRGRVALVGDAAHVPTPMTGSGFAASVDDAAAIASALADGNTTSIPDALARYEQTRLAPARQLVHSGQQFSRSFAR